jgi:thiamine biosynthesis lipoprotein
MGSFVALEAEAPLPGIAEEAIAAAWSAILTVERVMHPWRAGSDLALLGACAPRAVVQIHPWTWDVLRWCRELHATTGGAFDPAPTPDSSGLVDLELLGSSRVRTHRPTRLDLGGIAKGYAVDRAREALRKAGCSAGLVNAGGDLAVFGERSRTVWLGSVAARAHFELKNAAVAASDTGGVDHPPEHRGYYHGSERDSEVSGAVTVTAPRAVWADALTKCVLLLPAAPLAQLLRRFQARVLLHTRAARPA